MSDVAALDALAAGWRLAPDGSTRFVPAFDPAAGGTSAKVLVLLERPAPLTVGHGDFAVSSEDNGTASSRVFREARIASGLARTDYVRWNIVPWGPPSGVGSAITKTLLDEARPALVELLQTLPNLRGIVTLGRPALDGVMRYFTLAANPRVLPVLAAPHPSPANGRHRHEQHRRIVAALRLAAGEV